MESILGDAIFTPVKKPEEFLSSRYLLQISSGFLYLH